MLIPIEAIIVEPGHRKVRADKLKKIVSSIEAIGLQTPITVRPAKESGKYLLVAGRHRLDAHKKLGRTEIEAHLSAASALDAELWEIAENLHRADLTAMQRSLGEGRWVKLMAEKLKQDRKAGGVFRQDGGKLPPHRATGKPSGRPKGGISAAAEHLGIPETTARRSVNIANHLTIEAQKEAERLGFDDNLFVLNRASDVDRPDEQIATLHYFAEERERQKTKRQEQEAVEANIRAIVEGAAPPNDPPGWFAFQYRKLDASMQARVLDWLRDLDTGELIADLRRRAELLRADRSALH